MTRAAALLALALLLAAPAAAQGVTADSVRVELVRSRGFIRATITHAEALRESGDPRRIGYTIGAARAAETQLGKALALLDALIAGAPVPPAVTLDSALVLPPVFVLDSLETRQLCAVGWWSDGTVGLDAVQREIAECQRLLVAWQEGTPPPHPERLVATVEEAADAHGHYRLRLEWSAAPGAVVYAWEAGANAGGASASGAVRALGAVLDLATAHAGAAHWVCVAAATETHVSAARRCTGYTP